LSNAKVSLFDSNFIWSQEITPLSELWGRMW
jgi:hypothetical protein